MESLHDKYLLPVENIKRIIKDAFPEDIACKLTKEGKETFQLILTEFITFITSEAAENAAAEDRKTVSGADIIIALENLGFEHYTDILKEYLLKIKLNIDNNQKENQSKVYTDLS